MPQGGWWGEWAEVVRTSGVAKLYVSSPSSGWPGGAGTVKALQQLLAAAQHAVR